jgi:hypothetical protein
MMTLGGTIPVKVGLSGVSFARVYEETKAD